MLIGYARVSKNEQNLDLQMDALKRAGCEKIFCEKMSGDDNNREQYRLAIDHLRSGDTLVIWRTDRIGRSTLEMIRIMTELGDLGIGILIPEQGIDTRTSAGRLIFSIMAVIAQDERSRIIERTHAGLAAARARGRTGGRKFKLNPKQIQMLATLHKDPTNRIDDICKSLSIGRTSFFRYLSKIRNNSN